MSQCVIGNGHAERIVLRMKYGLSAARPCISQSGNFNNQVRNQQHVGGFEAFLVRGGREGEVNRSNYDRDGHAGKLHDRIRQTRDRENKTNHAQHEDGRDHRTTREPLMKGGRAHERAHKSSDPY